MFQFNLCSIALKRYKETKFLVFQKKKAEFLKIRSLFGYVI